MPSHLFNLSSQDVPFFSPLPGHVLLRVRPAETMTHSGLLHLPETYVEAAELMKAYRWGEVVKVNRGDCKRYKEHFREEDLDALVVGARVMYAGHADEAENEYVVVLHGQVVGVAEK